ncbi:MAG: hypothetical protein ACO3R4_05690, partial [Litorivicinaceae bacterium]
AKASNLSATLTQMVETGAALDIIDSNNLPALGQREITLAAIEAASVAAEEARVMKAVMGDINSSSTTAGVNKLPTIGAEAILPDQEDVSNPGTEVLIASQPEWNFPPEAVLKLASSASAEDATRLVSLTEARNALANSDAVAGSNKQVDTTNALGSTATNSGLVASADSQSLAAPVQLDVRIPARQGSMVDIVNGGVRLPEGVDQQLFVVSDEGIAER